MKLLTETTRDSSEHHGQNPDVPVPGPSECPASVLYSMRSPTSHLKDGTAGQEEQVSITVVALGQISK